MFTFSHLLIGAGIVAAGILIVKFTFQVANMTGRQDWIERYAGSGSTYGIYKIFGVLLVVLGLLIATGFGNNVLSFLLSPIKGIFRTVGNQN